MSDRYFTYDHLSCEPLLDRVKGIIHVGANYGQEREVYALHNLSVLWFEPIPWVWEELQENVSKLKGQSACRYAVWDRDEKRIPFHVTSNEGQSSSGLPPEKHSMIWPDVHEEKNIVVTAIRLDSFFEIMCFLNPSDFDFLVIDAQGAELKVLRGAEGILSVIKFIQVETTDCELYSGCALLSEIDAFMREHSFKEISRNIFSPRPDIGQCYEVTYERA